MIDPARLKAILLNTGLQQKDNALYQFLSSLIDSLLQIIKSLNASSSSSTSTSSAVTNIYQLGGLFEESLQEDQLGLSGSTATNAIDRQWSVLTNGNTAAPELIFAGGDVIMVSIP